MARIISDESHKTTDFLEGISSADSFFNVFTALRGIQAGREYYVAMCPLRLVPKLFLFDEKELPPSLRAQRILNRSRVPSISRYIVDSPKGYTFSSITASIDGRVDFKPLVDSGPASKAGYLIVPMTAKLLINDGQHRRAAIEDALRLMPELGAETISVVFFVDAGLKRSQQMFADLNKHAVRPTMSLGVLYDHREPLARLSVRLAENVPIFKDRTELERTSISNRSKKVFTLSSIYQATRALLGKGQKFGPITEEEEQLAMEYWDEVASCIKEWQLLQQDKITSAELRKSYIHAHGIALLALGFVGRALTLKNPRNWRHQLQKLKQVDWSRSNTKLWEGRALHAGRINAFGNNVALTTNILKRALGIALTTEEKELERRLVALKGRS
jgi:DNA sulfur modification protein DndB